MGGVSREDTGRQTAEAIELELNGAFKRSRGMNGCIDEEKALEAMEHYSRDAPRKKSYDRGKRLLHS